MSTLKKAIIISLLAALPVLLKAQFYSGSQQEFGKNRVQYDDFLWQYYRFNDLETYFYAGGRNIAQYVAISAHENIKEMEKLFDFAIDDRIQFIIYNKQSHFRQSNIGINGDEQFNIGGTTRIVGSKVFVYFEGDHKKLDDQIKSGISQVLLNQMMYGGNWKEVLKNSTLLNLPSWYTEGLISYASQDWDADLDSRVRDGVLSGRYDKFNRLEGEEARIFGHGIWNYVAQVYGENVIPNILYMTRISRNIESGFLFVLGVSLETLAAECISYYKAQFALLDRMRNSVELEELPIKTKKTRVYSQFKLSPDGRYAAFVSNELGQYKVWLYNISKDKVKKLDKGEHKLNRIVDKSYPILTWHPSSKAFSYVLERKGDLLMKTYSIDDKKLGTKPIFMLEKVLDFAYSNDGKKMIFSGVRDGQSDLYLYHVIGNRQEQLTNDVYDDLNPRFVKGTSKVIFSSNRPDDTLRTKVPIDIFPTNTDIFIYNLGGNGNLLERLTSTPGISEIQPAQYDSIHYTYLADGTGLQNRYMAKYDSVISHIDTTIHYRRFTTTHRISDLDRSILLYEVYPKRQRYSQLMFRDGKYRFYFGSTTQDKVTSKTTLNSDGELEESKEPIPLNKGGETVEPAIKLTDRSKVGTDVIDINNYTFENDVVDPAEEKKKRRTKTKKPVITLGASAKIDTTRKKLVFPEQRNYNINFATDEVLTQLDNSYSNQFYQLFTGPNNLNPGVSGMIAMGISDLFEDYKIIGGFRLSLNLNNNDYLLSFQDLSRRMDKKITFQRQSLRGATDFSIIKIHTHQIKYELKWPFSEVTSLRTSFLYRNDRAVYQSTDLINLRQPNGKSNMLGVKLAYVFDNTLPKGLNLYNGFRFKIFAEYYQEPDAKESDIQIVGFDARHYLKIHRDIIWANRIAGSSSFGNRKLAYFMGGVDNWLFSKVDNSIPIDYSQNYFYQSLASPVRGFYYNARNGNSFGVINSEIRVPLFRYLIQKPIRSDFVQTFQVVLFGDVGSAWTGLHPYSEENSFNTQTIDMNPISITIQNQREPLIYGYGFGLRSRILGYFVRADWAWGVDDGIILPGVFHFSLNLDF